MMLRKHKLSDIATASNSEESCTVVVTSKGFGTIGNRLDKPGRACPKFYIKNSGGRGAGGTTKTTLGIIITHRATMLTTAIIMSSLTVE